MQKEELYRMKASDVGAIRRDRTDWEASRIPALHDKWLKLLLEEKDVLARMKRGMASLFKLKHEYYKGKAAPDAYKEKPFDLKLKLKADYGMYIDADPEIQALDELVLNQAHKVEYLEKTLTEITKRSYLINAVIESLKFKHGLSSRDMKLDIDDEDLQISSSGERSFGQSEK
jgi:hypothetical protein